MSSATPMMRGSGCGNSRMADKSGVMTAGPDFLFTNKDQNTDVAGLEGPGWAGPSRVLPLGLVETVTGCNHSGDLRHIARIPEGHGEPATVGEGVRGDAAVVANEAFVVDETTIEEQIRVGVADLIERVRNEPTTGSEPRFQTA